jgi:hypothetical protein
MLALGERPGYTSVAVTGKALDALGFTPKNPASVSAFLAIHDITRS